MSSRSQECRAVRRLARMHTLRTEVLRTCARDCQRVPTQRRGCRVLWTPLSRERFWLCFCFWRSPGDLLRGWMPPGTGRRVSFLARFLPLETSKRPWGRPEPPDRAAGRPKNKDARDSMKKLGGPCGAAHKRKVCRRGQIVFLPPQAITCRHQREAAAKTNCVASGSALLETLCPSGKLRPPAIQFSTARPLDSNETGPTMH